MLRKKGRVYVGLGILDFGSGVVACHLETGTGFFFFSISAFENGIKGQVRMSIKNL